MKKKIRKTRLGVKNQSCIDLFLRQTLRFQENHYLRKYNMSMDELYSSGEIGTLNPAIVDKKIREHLAFIFDDPSDAHRIVAYFLQLGGKPTSYYMISKHAIVRFDRISGILFKLVKYQIFERKRFGKRFFVCNVKGRGK